MGGSVSFRTLNVEVYRETTSMLTRTNDMFPYIKC